MEHASDVDINELVRKLRRQGRDSSDVEVKASVKRLPESLPSTISSFSNTRGGVVILGLDEASGFKPAEGFDAARISEALKELVRPRLSGESMAPLSPAPLTSIDVREFEDAELVVAVVEELPPDQKPCFVTAKGVETGSFERLLDGDHRMSTHAIFLLSSNRKQPTRDVDVVPGASLTDLDEDLLEGLVGRVRMTRPRLAAMGSSRDEILKLLKVIDPATDGVTLAGLLALGKYPQAFFPQLVVSFVSFPTRSPGGSEGNLRMLDRADFEGPIPWMVVEAVKRVGTNLTTRRVSEGPTSRDVTEIPLDVIREAIVNSVAHRDYSSFSESEQVKVELYPDRLEVKNPGGLWGGQTHRDLSTGQSRSRNSYLTRLLTDVPLPDSSTVSENLGTGISFMIGSMKSLGLPVPSFKFDHTSFSTVLARHGLLDPAMALHLELVGAAGLPDLKRATLALALRNKGTDDQSLRFQLDMDSLDAWRLLEQLVADGWLERDRRGTYTPTVRLSSTPLLQVEDSAGQDSGLHPIVNLLASRSPRSVREIADALGWSLPKTRNQLRDLLANAEIVATAPPTSRRRRYRLQ